MDEHIGSPFHTPTFQPFNFNPMFYLKVTDLTKSYTSNILVDHVNFTISKGQKVALVAKNGAGKSTLLKLLMKELDLSDGTIERREGVRI